jgi:tetratricopeptide (TPR) repeat protein
MPADNSQVRFDAAVVVQTVLRPSLLRAVRSVYRQDLPGRIQVLVGIDVRQGDDSILDRLRQECPDTVCLTVIDLGYSTAHRHGGTYSNGYGGGLRTILSYAANSFYVAYLDDDDWWSRDHLSSLRAAIQGKAWAFSRRWLVDQETGWAICRDEWDSVGPRAGGGNDRFGGFCAPSTLMLEKQSCHFVLPLWSLAGFSDGTGEDRLVFDALQREHPWAATGQYTSHYEMRRPEQAQAHHADAFAARKIGWVQHRAQIAAIAGLAQAAEAARQAGQPEAAIAACRQALALNPNHVATLVSLATAEWLLGMTEDAIDHFALSREIDDTDPAVAKTPRT